MPLELDRTPKAVQTLAARAANRALSTARGRRLRLPFKLTPGIPIYAARMRSIGPGWLSNLQRTGWAVFLLDADEHSIKLEMTLRERRPYLSHITYGRPSTQLLDRLATIEQQAPAHTRLRLLTVPELFFQAAWLHAPHADVFYLLHRGRGRRHNTDSITTYLASQRVLPIVKPERTAMQ